jgi:hypothetical protein
MSESNEQAKPKSQRASRAGSTIMTRSLRRILKQKAPNPEQPKAPKESWAEKVNVNLVHIASERRSAVGLQAIKMVFDHAADPVAVAESSEDADSGSNNAALRAKSEEEIEAEIKELRARLGSIVPASA